MRLQGAGRLSRLAIIVALATPMLAGCGGKSAHQKLVDSANAICRASGKQAKKLNPTGKGSLVDIATRVAAIVDNIRTKISRLTPPAGDKALFIRFMAAFDRRTASARAVREAARAGHMADVQRLLVRSRQEVAQASVLAHQLRFDACVVKG